LWGDVLTIQTVANRIEPVDYSAIDYTSEVELYHKQLLESKKALRYLYKRGITLESAKRFNLGFMKRYNQDWLCIPSYENNVPKLLKYRKIPPDTNAKLPKCIREEGGKSVLFNSDTLDQYNEIFVVEGEIDAITLIQNGYENVVGMTVGAGSLLPEWYDLLTMKEKIYLILDPDSVGQSAAKDVWATRLGFDKCWNILLPEEIKGEKCDPNLFFLHYTKDDFDKLIDQAYQFKVEGLITLGDSLYNLYLKSQDEEFTTKYELPWPNVNRLLNGGLKQTRLTVLGGSPGCLAKDTNISFGLNLEQAYRKQLSYTLSYTGYGTKFHEIEKIVYSGKKELYKITTLKGLTIKSTLDHEFKTHKYLYSPNTGYASLSQLEIGCFVLVVYDSKIVLDVITDIQYYGVDDTYDIIMKEPYRNFIANNFVVHNSGKTTMALQIQYYFAKKYGMPSLMFNMEMPETALVTKIVQLDRDLVEDEVDPSSALVYAMDLRELPIYLAYSSKITPEVFYNTMRMARDRYGVRLGIFDNIQRLVRTGKESDMAQASGVFKNITMDLNVLFILISQPRKTKDEETNGLPTYYDMKGSSALAEDADEAIILHRKRLRKDEGIFDPITKVIVDKGRYSAGGMTQLYLDGAKSKFIEVPEGVI